MKRPRTRVQLRKWLQDTIRHPVSEALWTHLVEAAFVEGALDPEEPDGLKDLLGQARKFSALMAGSQVSKRKRGPRPAEVLAFVPREEALRAQVFSNYLARIAAYTPAVGRFRDEILGGKTLTREQAGILLDSEGPRFFDYPFFKEHSIPLVGHRSWIVNYDQAGRLFPMYSPLKSVFEFSWKGGEFEIPHTWEQHLKSQDGRTPRLAILSQRFTSLLSARGFGRGGLTSVLQGSVFDRLREVSFQLVKEFGWSEDQAAWWVLTGLAPTSRPIEVEPLGLWRQDCRRLHLRITIEPWVSPTTLLGVYRYMQQKSMGRQSHRFSVRNLQLVDEVSEFIHQNDPMPSWRTLMGMWNQAHPDLAYDSPQRFHRDYMRTIRNLVYPTYHWPWFEAPKTTTVRPPTSRRTRSRPRPASSR